MWSSRVLGAALAALASLLAATGAAAQTPPPAASPSPVPSAPAAPAPIQNVPPTPAPAAPEPAPSPAGDCSPEASACISANQFERFTDGHSQFRGFVDLLFGDTRIQTDKLDLFEAARPDGGTARRLVAEGNVVFIRGEERLSGEKLDMQLDTSRGTFENAFGYVSPGVLVEGKRIERIGPSEYRIEDGKFTSCMQPNPRWSFTASSATLEVDNKVKARNVLFRIKDVPAFYIPYFVYPIQEDQRSTGLLFPHFGDSGLRGFNIGGGFFWAMSRSLDQTFYADHYSKYGWGYGHEFRYLRPSPSRGTFRTYLFRRTGGAGWEHDFNWDAIQTLPGRVKASLRVEESSTIEFQEQFQEDLDLASRRSRYWTANLQRSFGPTLVQVQADSTDTFYFEPDQEDVAFDRRRHLPSVLVNQSPRKLRRTGLVFGYEARGEALEVGNQVNVEGYSRVDLNPRLSRPLSRSFLQLTPQVQARYTRYGSQVDLDTGALDPTPIERRYLEGSLEMRGPSVSRVVSTPGNFYSERFKHVLTPEVTYTYRSKFEEFDRIPRFDYLDFFPGTNEVRYGLVQQLYAKRPGRTGKLEPYEFLSWRVHQTYYVDIAEGQNQFDPNYSSAVFGPGGEAAHLSPLQSRLRIRPTPQVSTNFDLEYDVNFREIRSLSLSTGVNYGLFGLDARWFRGAFRTRLGDVGRERNTVRGSGRVALLPGRLTAAGSVDYDVANKNLVQSTARLRYDVQCCGFIAEMIQSDYNVKDRQFRFSIELANIGSIGNFLGQDAAAGNRGFLAGR
ncbi:MAG TPA: LPS assembly protein LptD [Vicinamibacteria bacterium]|nr:LPS assembly protein LptD [Vicinamibacteria bacterium]